MQQVPGFDQFTSEEHVALSVMIGATHAGRDRHMKQLAALRGAFSGIFGLKAERKEENNGSI